MQLLFVVIFPNRTQDASHGRFSGNNTWTKRQVPCTMPSKEGTEAKDEPMNQTESATSQPPGAIPLPDEIVVNKTTDSVSLGTNYTQLLQNMGIDTVIVTGVVTDQCVAGTIRVLADQGFRIYCPEDCCAAGSKELHEQELRIMNVIYGLRNGRDRGLHQYAARGVMK